MLVLAGVSLNAIVGDNGILNQAKKAKIASDKASILELLDTELASYNIDTITGNPENIVEMFNSLLSKGVIDKVLWSDNEYKADEISSATEIRGIPNFSSGSSEYTMDYSVEKDNYKIKVTADKQGIYKSEYGEIDLSAGGTTVAGGTTLVTENAFTSTGGGTTAPEDQGKFTVSDDSSVMFVDEIGFEEVDGKIPELSIYVPANTTANIYVFENMKLTNETVDRSAIDIEPTGILNLWIAEGKTLTVDSGFGKVGEDGNVSGSKGGPGGYAGIHVPKDSSGKAVLNLSGSGTIIAYGGKAGKGGNAITTGSVQGGAGGGGAGAGIGGNGGRGGNGNSTQIVSLGIYSDKDNDDNPATNTNCGWDGEAGEDCGDINIKDTTVYAYGGGGASGGDGKGEGAGGGGGYPAAGIGGGRSRSVEVQITAMVLEDIVVEVVKLEEELEHLFC